ncbi:hypothetical protein CHELA20_54452 [Hyphomicrobiales bacterium]|nr:hypothetical protein CHELA41_20474 [Hyphomicrobiales bacterium]CAH1686292.1 hypothetical protein CHELA20_54452 [Hyphomicrobiales bacterium]
MTERDQDAATADRAAEAPSLNVEYTRAAWCAFAVPPIPATFPFRLCQFRSFYSRCLSMPP